MITSKDVKKLNSLHSPKHRPVSVGFVGEKAVIFSKVFYFELPKGEVLEEAATKYPAATPPDAEWREHLLNKVPAEPAVPSRETFTPNETGVEPMEVVRLQGSKTIRYIRAEYFDFFNDQLLRPSFKVYEGTRADDSPSAVTIHEGNDLVGCISALDLNDGETEEA